MQRNISPVLSDSLPLDDLLSKTGRPRSSTESQASSPRSSAEFKIGDGPEISSAAETLLKNPVRPIRSRNVSTARLLLLTVSSFGIQGIWSLLMSYGTLYLQSLGFSSTLTAIVWLAGPLSGAFFQPLVGAHSDRCKSRFGRRKPYIVGGTVGTIICLLGLASAREVVNLFREKEWGSGMQPHDVAVKAVAVFWVYALKLAIQPLQAGVRAFIVENCPSEQQVEASAWVARFNNLGSVFTFLLQLGSHCWPELMRNTRFMALSVLASAVLVIVVPLSLMASEGSKPELEVEEEQISKTTILTSLIFSARNMPPRSWQVCKIQFFAWMGWFPLLYYNTAYIASLSMSSVSKSPSPTGSNLSGIAARDGSFASFLFATMALVNILALPALARVFKPLTLPLLWKCSHILFAVAMFSTYFAHTVQTGTVLVAIVGISWSITQWVPYAIIGQEVASINERYAEDRWDDAAPRIPALGAILGLHNSFIAAPQIVAGLVCSILFKLFEALEVEDSFGWVLRCAGICGLAAAWMSWKL